MLNKVASIYSNILLKKMNSTKEALKVFEKIEYWVWFMKTSFWIAIFLIFFYIDSNLKESYILFVIFAILFPFWSHFNQIVNNSYAENKSCLENLNLHIGDKIDFIEKDGYRREGELTRISMTWFEFRYKNSSIHSMEWLTFHEKDYILVWTKYAGDGVEKVTTPCFLNPNDERIESLIERLKEKRKNDEYLKTAEISTNIDLNNILVLTCSIEIVAGKRNHYEMLNKLNTLIWSTMREMKIYYYDSVTHTFKNTYH